MEFTIYQMLIKMFSVATDNQKFSTEVYKYSPPSIFENILSSIFLIKITLKTYKSIQT